MKTIHTTKSEEIEMHIQAKLSSSGWVKKKCELKFEILIFTSNSPARHSTMTLMWRRLQFNEQSISPTFPQWIKWHEGELCVPLAAAQLDMPWLGTFENWKFEQHLWAFPLSLSALDRRQMNVWNSNYQHHTNSLSDPLSIQVISVNLISSRTFMFMIHWTAERVRSAAVHDDWIRVEKEGG